MNLSEEELEKYVEDLIVDDGFLTANEQASKQK